MELRPFGWMATILCSFVLASAAEAQTILERLGQQLQLNPPSPTAAQPVPPPPDDSLPPPRDRESVPTNSVSRASLGIRVGPVTEELVRDLGLVVRRGAIITAIEKGSAADRAGLPLGGIIVALDGRRVDSPADLTDAVQASRPGQDVELTYYDRNKLARKKVHLAAVGPAGFVAVPDESPRTTTIRPPAPANPLSSPSLERELGAGGSRPLLGKIGKVLDSIAPPTPASPAADPTIANRVEPESEVALLRQQLADLTRQVEALRKQVASLEQKLSEKK